MVKELHKGDSILVTDKDNGLPKTLYYITSETDDRYEAFVVYVGKESLQALDFPQSFTKDVSEYAYPVSLDVLNNVREEMADWIDEIHGILPKSEGNKTFSKEAGKVYTDGRNLYKLTELKEGRWRYQLFLMSPENICGFEAAHGDKQEEDIKGFCPVSDSVVQTIYERLGSFINKTNAMLSKLIETEAK
jgi:hypothetical protein